MSWKIYRHPSDSAGPTEDVGENRTAEDHGSDQGAPPEGVNAKLEAELAASKTESEQWRDRFLRKAAEFENYRKRIDREKAESGFLVRSSLLSEFLPIMDACERALDSFGSQEKDEKVERYREGVQLLYKHVGDTLKRLGVEAMKAQGQPFDPHFHEAVSRQPSAQHDDNTVVHELRRGYLYQGRLLRPAQVVVSSAARDGEPPQT